AELTQLQILYDPALVRGLTTGGVSGAKTPSEALGQVLAPTGITFELTAGDAVALHAAGHSNSTGSYISAGPSRPTTVTVHGDRIAAGSYSSGATVAGMKIDESAMIVPVTTQS